MIFFAKISFENAFLYFFSAIPQVLGTLIGLLGVFLLFKFQSINKSIIGFGEQVLSYLVTEPFLVNITDRQIRLSKNWLKGGLITNDQETVVSQVSGINYRLEQLRTEKDFTDHDDLNIKSERLGVLQNFKNYEHIQWACLEFKYNTTQRSKRLLAHCIGVIIISLAFLLVVPILSNHNIIALFVLAIIILLWFVKCLTGIIWLVILSLAHDFNGELMPNENGFFSEIKEAFKKNKTVYKRQER